MRVSRLTLAIFHPSATPPFACHLFAGEQQAPTRRRTRGRLKQGALGADFPGHVFGLFGFVTARRSTLKASRHALHQWPKGQKQPIGTFQKKQGTWQLGQRSQHAPTWQLRPDVGKGFRTTDQFTSRRYCMKPPHQQAHSRPLRRAVTSFGHINPVDRLG